MTIWVDADACPVSVRNILIRAAQRTGLPLTFVCNQYINLPPLKNIKLVQVASGYDAADNEIAQRAQVGHFVITGDLPLAAEVVDKGCFVLSFRGEQFTRENIKARLNMRDFMETMRASGVQSGGPAAMNAQDSKRFADQFDRLLKKYGQPPSG